MRIKLKKKALDKAYKIVAKAEQTFTLNCAPHSRQEKRKEEKKIRQVFW